MNRILKLQSQLANKPFGKKLFSYLIARAAPYSLTISPFIEELHSGYMRTSMKNRRKVQNHLKGVFATAICTLCEFTAGICMESSIPKNKRWIPIGMKISYIKMGKSKLNAVCDLSTIDWDNTLSYNCVVNVTDANGQKISEAIIEMKISDKKSKK